jgi:hypothetical protein
LIFNKIITTFALLFEYKFLIKNLKDNEKSFWLTRYR